MKAVAPFVALAVAALVAAGCSGGPPGAGALPTASNPSGPGAALSAAAPAAADLADAALNPDHRGRCGGHHHGCRGGQLVVPLTFDGTNFTVASGYDCRGGKHDATPYVAPTTGPLTLAGNVTIAPVCVPGSSPSASPSAYPSSSPSTGPSSPSTTPSPSPSSSPPSGKQITWHHGGWHDRSLYIVGIEVPGSGSGGKSDASAAPDHHRGTGLGHGWQRAALVAGPASLDENPWSFAPLAPGLSMQQGASYEFFIVSAPSSVSPSPTPSACPSCNPSGSPTPSACPSCNPSGSPTPSACPSCNPSGSPSPAPTQSPSGKYLLLAPLSFNGSTFSPVGSGVCGGQNDQPYVAPTSGPLALPGSVVLAPMCVPSPLPSNLPGNLQVSIVAIDVTSSSGGGWHHHHQATPQWHGGGGTGFLVPAVQVAGPEGITNNPWTFAPASPGLTMNAGDSYAFFVAVAPPAPPALYHPLVPLDYDGTSFTVPSSFTSCQQWWDETPYVAPTSGPLALGGSIDVTPVCTPPSNPSNPSANAPQLYVVAAQLPNNDAVRSHHYPRDWGVAFAAIPIAGPVSASSNPWSFSPLAPGLTMTAGDGYVFFVATQVSQHWGGGGGGHRH